MSVKRLPSIGLLLLAIALISASRVSHASDWVALFNGKDLSGWENNGQETWIVDDGAILCESTANQYGYLTTEKTFRNFDLRLKFKPDAGGNSGVFPRSKIIGGDLIDFSMPCEGWPRYLISRQRRSPDQPFTLGPRTIFWASTHA